MGAIFAIFAGFYYWIEKIIGLQYNYQLANLHFILFFIGVNVLFFPLHFLLRRSSFLIKLFTGLYVYLILGTLAYHPSDIRCIVGQRARDVGPKKCIVMRITLLSVLPQDIWLAQANLYKTPSRRSNELLLIIRTYCNTPIVECGGRLKYSSSGHRRDLSINITASYKINDKNSFVIYFIGKSLNQSGNPVKYWIAYIETLNHVRWCRYSKLYTWTIKDEIWMNSIFSGGKIANKAKVHSNVWNSVVIYLYNNKNGNMTLVKSKYCIRCHYYKNIFSREIVKVSPRLRGNTFRLNLVRPERVTNNHFGRTFSISTLSSVRVLKKKCRKPPISWPKNWVSIEERVFSKQCVLSKLADENGLNSIVVQNYQNFLVSSLDFRLVAARRLRSNKGSKTAGIDQVILLSNVQWINLVEKLGELENYKSKPVRRVNIPKNFEKTRPLGIPTIFDRAVQSLFKLIIEPITEVNADINSYGFRKNRNAHQALAKLRSILVSKPGSEDIVILSLDIKGFFDNICHKWIMDNFPISNKYKYILCSWLVSGVVVRGKDYEPTETGVPQGGIISPVISNFVLDGLEECVYNSIQAVTSGKSRTKGFRGSITNDIIIKRFNIQFIRYADDFIITCRSMYIAKEYIKPKIINFLKERGVWLSEEKSSIFRLKHKKLDFLGYSFIWSPSWKPKGVFNGKTGRPGIAVIPQKSKFKTICKKIRNTFHFNLNDDAYTLVTKLNPIIRGWCDYFKYGQSVACRKKLEYYLYKLCWKWARRKHRRWGLKRIAAKYFLRKNKAKFKDRVWAFRGQTWNKSRYKDNLSGGKSIFLINPVGEIDTLSMFSAKLENKLKHIHGYHQDISKVDEFLVNQKVKNKKKHNTLKDKLFTKQKGVCPFCRRTIESIEKGDVEIHHKVAISKKGSRSSIKNMELLHKYCHYEHHCKHGI